MKKLFISVIRNADFFIYILLVVFAFYSIVPLYGQTKKPITIEDYAQWKTLSQQKISNDGKWLVYVLKPNEGNGKLIIQSLENKTKFIKIRGSRPVFSEDSKWVAYTILPEDSLSEKEKKNTKNGMGLLNLYTGETVEVDSVENFRFSKDGNWFFYKLVPHKKKKAGKKKPGSPLVIKNLKTGATKTIKYVVNYSIDKNSKFIAYSVSSNKESEDGLYIKNLKGDGSTITLLSGKGKYLQFSWSEDSKKFAFVSNKNDSDSELPLFDLYLWYTERTKPEMIVESSKSVFPDNMVVSEYGELKWSEDGKKLFFGIAPEEKKELSKEEKEKLPGVDIWHWRDVEVQPQQKINATKRKKQTYTAIYHIYDKYSVALGDRNFKRVYPSPDGNWAIGINQKPYFESIPWRYPNFMDLYVINTKTGTRRIFLKKALRNGIWSPEGDYIVYYFKKHWWLYSVKDAVTKNLTKELDVPFWNVDDDHPDVKRPYGPAYWLKNDEGVLLYDKYDIWMFPVNKKGKPVNITAGIGRKRNATFRYIRLDREEKYIDPAKPIILSFFNNKTKATGYYRLKIGQNRPVCLVEKDKMFRGLQKAKNANRYIMTIQTFEEFPDVYITDGTFKEIHRVTDANPQQKNYAWGKNRLIEWKSLDGIPLQGVLTYPANYIPGKKYPMVVYIYERLSNVLHQHYIPLANHRFNATVFASNGYAVFKPDIKYTIGHPGQSALKCVVPGVLKIIEMGIADPKRIGLQGHSWGGYETAYIITQTDIFSAAIAGAPVSNMTSAYGGIRWGSGLPRQFQYERTQSRIGGSLWEFPERYIENSPLFFCDRVKTPLLILHGDKDGAVPWYQGIELYLALRRLGKPVIMLEYNDEPHHLTKKKNKYDFTKRMWEFFEHYLRDKPAPEWIEKGVPFLEKGTK